MRLTPLDESRKAESQVSVKRAEELKEQGICPTCHDRQHGGVYPPTEDRTFYEDDLVQCMLISWPRNPGHTVVLVKPHFEDFTEIPVDLCGRILPAVHAAASALKSVLGAQKVYMCSMCDGRRNHLHFQRIPRMPGDTIIGSRLFVKDRNYLEDYAEVVRQLRQALHGKTKAGKGA